MIIIKECKASDYIENNKEINSFIQAKKNIDTITNIERLLNLIKIYFETAIYYQNHSTSKFIIKIKGRYYKSVVSSYDEKGNKLEVSIIDISSKFISEIINEIRKNITLETFKRLIILLNAILQNGQITTTQRLSLIYNENISFPNEWNNLIRILPEEIAEKSIQIRKNLIIKALKEPTQYKNNEDTKEYIKALNEGYINYIKLLIKVQISNNHITDIFKLIGKELTFLEQIKDIDNANINLIVFFLLDELINNNNLFLFETKDEIIEILEDYKEFISEEEKLLLEENLSFNPENFELGEASIELAEPNFQNINENEIQTIITFVVNKRIDKKFISHTIENNIVEFENIENLFEDPVYLFLDSTNLNISGMPLTYLSDSVGNINNTSKINITIPNFYHPDFDIENNKIIYKDFKKENAMHSGKYYPHKEFILNILFKLNEKKLIPFEIDEKDINANLISNYIIVYKTKQNKLIHHKLFTITNFNSYFEIKKRFLTKMQERYLEDSFLQIKDLLYKVDIVNNKVFLDFCVKLLELTIKKSIELSGLHKSLWKDVNGNIIPLKETEAQTVLYNQIKDIAEIKGIRVSREIIAADGSLDFHFHYTKNDISMNVCVELKNAHHNLLEHGISSQLPLYIKDVGRKEGIFLVLWYKCDKFIRPEKYSTIKELEEFLISKIPNRFKIKPLIINCTPKVSPSKKDSEKRL